MGTNKTIGLFQDCSRPKGKLIHDIHGVILSTHKPSVCDPLACIAVFNPELITGIYKAYGRIEMGGHRTSGMLSLDWFKEEIKGKEKIWALSDIEVDKLVKNMD
jgi:inosine-uridine nucleoside N-ribohydrolase